MIFGVCEYKADETRYLWSCDPVGQLCVGVSLIIAPSVVVVVVFIATSVINTCRGV